MVAVVGCASGGDSPEVALTKVQFIKRGDAICRAGQAKKEKAVGTLAQDLSKEGKELEDLSPTELDHVYVTLVLPPIKKASAELGELGLPTGDVQAEKLVASLAAAVKSIEEKPRRAFEETPYLHADELAYAYGFKACNEF